jgi:hypothetical protein
MSPPPPQVPPALAAYAMGGCRTATCAALVCKESRDRTLVCLRGAGGASRGRRRRSAPPPFSLIRRLADGRSATSRPPVCFRMENHQWNIRGCGVEMTPPPVARRRAGPRLLPGRAGAAGRASGGDGAARTNFDARHPQSRSTRVALQSCSAAWNLDQFLTLVTPNHFGHLSPAITSDARYPPPRPAGVRGGVLTDHAEPCRGAVPSSLEPTPLTVLRYSHHDSSRPLYPRYGPRVAAMMPVLRGAPGGGGPGRGGGAGRRRFGAQPLLRRRAAAGAFVDTAVAPHRSDSHYTVMERHGLRPYMFRSCLKGELFRSSLKG